MSYKKLEVWKLAREVAIEIHKMTLQELPKFEMFEVGNQIRRSSKSICANIVEGYGRRRYKQDYLKFITYAFASTLETIDHLDMLYETGSLQNEVLYKELNNKLDILGKKLNLFLQAVERGHRSHK